MVAIPATGTTAWIEVAKAKAQEYKVEVTTGLMNTHKASCFIEAMEGEEFEIHVESHSQVISVKLMIDGEVQANQISEPGGLCCIRGRRVGPSTIRPFMFQKIRLTDEDDIACQEEEIVKNLGTIVLELRRIVKLGRTLGPGTNHFGDPKEKTFHEKSKKAQLAQTAGFGQAQFHASNSVNVNYIDSADLPAYCTYTFSYRHNTWLEIHNHKASTQAVNNKQDGTSSGSNQRKRPAESSGSAQNPREASGSGADNGDDLEAELARLREENARLKRVKLEKDVKPELHGSSSKGKGVKKEKVVISIDSDSD